MALLSMQQYDWKLEFGGISVGIVCGGIGSLVADLLVETTYCGVVVP